MLWLMESLGVTHNIFKPLIVWNNPFGVDVPFTEKPGGLFPQAGTEYYPRVSF